MADGTILTEAQAKAYCEIEHAGDDTLVGDLIEQAEAALQSYLGVPITATETRERHDGGRSSLFLDRWPLDEDSVVVADAESNVVSNGDFYDGSDDWTAGSGWSIASGKATHSSGTAALSQSVSIDDAKPYLVVFTVSGRTVGSVTAAVGGTSGTARSAGGTFAEVIYAGTSDELMKFTPTTGFDGSVDDVRVSPVIDPGKFRVYPERGEVVRTSATGVRSLWPTGRRRWEVLATGGLDQHPDWSSIVEPDLRRSLADLVKEHYDNRDPGAKQTREGAGIGRTNTERWIPERVLAIWQRYREPLW